uniref:Uncharacterized protein n=1 Tax=Romanomermis culicivorax TaxID=13658 RepID=A0A915IZM9_ROMCU
MRLGVVVRPIGVFGPLTLALWCCKWAGGPPGQTMLGSNEPQKMKYLRMNFFVIFDILQFDGVTTAYKICCDDKNTLFEENSFTFGPNTEADIPIGGIIAGDGEATGFFFPCWVPGPVGVVVPPLLEPFRFLRLLVEFEITLENSQNGYNFVDNKALMWMRKS